MEEAKPPTPDRAVDLTSSKAPDGPIAPAANAQHVQRALDKLSDHGRMNTSETILALAGTMGANPLHQKMTPEHITQVLDLSAKHDEREFSLATDQQKMSAAQESRNATHRLVVFGVAVGLLVFVLVWLKDQPELLKVVLTGIGGFLGGFLAGMGYVKVKED